ncbi:MAG: ABC transporter substrate-binding protein [Gemmatimonadales bacterium]
MRGVSLRAAALLLGSALVCLPAGGTPMRIVAVDDAGDSVRLDAPARLVVSLDPTTTELLFAIGAGHTVVGRTDACDFPTEAKQVPSLGGGIPPNVEAVAGARPDLVLLYHGGTNAEPAARLRALGIPLARLRTDRLDDVPRLTRLLGELTGAGRGADSVARIFSRDLARERAASEAAGIAPVPVLILAWDQPLIVLGAGSYVSEAVELAGARNVFDDVASPSAQVTLESVVDREPRAILAMSASGETLSRRPEWRTVSAAREGRILRLDESAYNHPGPRMPAAIHELRARLAAIP